MPETITEADRNRNHKPKAQHTRAPLVMILNRSLLLDLVNTPKKQTHAVEQCDSRKDRESPCRGYRTRVSEVEQGCCDRTEDDGEFELPYTISEDREREVEEMHTQAKNVLSAANDTFGSTRTGT